MNLTKWITLGVLLSFVFLTTIQAAPVNLPPEQPPVSGVPPADFTDCQHDYEGIWYCERETPNSQYGLLYVDLSNPNVRVDVVMPRFSTNPNAPAVETVSQMAQRYADRYPGLQVVAGINANYFGPGHHGPQGLIKATTRQGGTPSGPFVTLFSPYLNTETHDGVEHISSLGISPDGRLLIDRDFYNQHAGFIGGETGEGRAVTAGPRILRQGNVLPADQFVENCRQENYPSTYCTDARQRAVLGTIGHQGLVLTVGEDDVLRNTALLLQQHGVENGMKLDDGSSAQLWYVDDPFIPPGGGNAVANAILVYSRPISEQVAFDTIFVIDVSGSMEEPTEGNRKIDWAQSAANSVISMIEHESNISGSSNRVAVVTFSTNASLDLALTHDYERARQVIERLVPDQRTNMGAGLEVAHQVLNSATAGTRNIILLSDGLVNEGASPSAILSDLVPQLTAQGACIFTVGFGEAGELEEDLLQAIASASNCGTYSHTNAPQTLLETYVSTYLASTGEVVGRFTGQIRQNETQVAGEVTLQRGQGQARFAGIGGGSDLDLIVTDPRGRRVDHDYPGASWMESNRLDYLIVQNPRPGNWLLEVYGADVPEEVLDYSVIAAVQEEESSHALWLSQGSLLAIGTLAFVVAVGVGVLAAQQSGGGRSRVGVQVLDGTKRSFIPFRRQLTIGRHPQNKLVLRDPQVSARHALIHRTPQGYTLTDLNSRNGTFVNDNRIGEIVLLRGGDNVRVGRTLLLFVNSNVRAGGEYTPTTAMAYLVVLAGDQEFARCPVVSGTVIGRHPGCPVDLSADALISRQHARIDYRNGRWSITNLKDENATIVNGRPVQTQVLKNGDTIQMGRTRMRFVLG